MRRFARRHSYGSGKIGQHFQKILPEKIEKNFKNNSGNLRKYFHRIPPESFRYTTLFTGSIQDPEKTRPPLSRLFQPARETLPPNPLPGKAPGDLYSGPISSPSETSRTWRIPMHNTNQVSRKCSQVSPNFPFSTPEMTRQVWQSMEGVSQAGSTNRIGK